MTMRAPITDAHIGDDTIEWRLWSTTARVVVLDPSRLRQAFDLVVDHLAEVDRVASRFRDDSEIKRLAAADGRPVPVSPLLAQYLDAALEAAERTDGDVDPSLGRALIGAGYDRDFDALEKLASSRPDAERGGRIVVERAATWRDIGFDGTTVTVPPGLDLDLGATAKALAADQAAALVHERLGTGVLVSLGGDIATAGPAPEAGWSILVRDREGEPASTVAIPGGAAMATSSTLRRRWVHDGRAMHHILDPRTLRPASAVWRTVTVVARTCLDANTLSTAAIVRGAAGRSWLEDAGVAARMVAASGTVVLLGGWPQDAES